MSQPPILRLQNVGVRYSNGAQAVEDVSMDVMPGSRTAVLGRNGAGKTSLLRGVAGFLRSEHVSVSGKVIVGDVDIAGGTPLEATKRGIAIVPEREKIFPSLTVAEHFRLIEPSSTPDSARLRFEALGRLWGSRAGLLSGGERQMLAIAMALLHRPKLLLIDEMSLGLAPVIVKSLMRHLEEITTASGVATLLVEQDATAALRVAEHVYLLDRGRIVWQGRSDETTSEELGRNYLGTKL